MEQTAEICYYISMNNKISSLAFKCRGLFWGVFALGFLVFTGTFSLTRYCLGLLFVFAGQAVRLWAAGYIPEYRTEVIGAPKLVTSGPYAYVRNPLYAGNFIMGIGWAVMAGWGWVVAFCAAFFLLYCLIIIPAEEEFLGGKFGEQYAAYKKSVNALFPKFCIPAAAAEDVFKFSTAFALEKYSVRMHVLITVLLTLRLIFIR